MHALKSLLQKFRDNPAMSIDEAAEQIEAEISRRNRLSPEQSREVLETLREIEARQRKTLWTSGDERAA